MGGRGSGGSRVGAGRKPKDALLRAIQGGRSRTPGAIASAAGASSATAVAPAEEVAPPADLTPDELIIWQREAPLATAERTLTPTTATAFRELVELEALKTRMKTRIQDQLTIADGEGGESAHPLITHYRGAIQRLAAFRKDFKLAPLGKEILQPQQPQANPVDRFRKRG